MTYYKPPDCRVRTIIVLSQVTQMHQKQCVRRSHFYLVYTRFQGSNLICHTLRAVARYGISTADKAKRNEPSQVTSVSAFCVSPTRGDRNSFTFSTSLTCFDSSNYTGARVKLMATKSRQLSQDSTGVLFQFIGGIIFYSWHLRWAGLHVITCAVY